MTLLAIKRQCPDDPLNVLWRRFVYKLDVVLACFEETLHKISINQSPIAPANPFMIV
jgi:hypothetical protein